MGAGGEELGKSKAGIEGHGARCPGSQKGDGGDGVTGVQTRNVIKRTLHKSTKKNPWRGKRLRVGYGVAGRGICSADTVDQPEVESVEK